MNNRTFPKDIENLIREYLMPERNKQHMLGLVSRINTLPLVNDYMSLVKNAVWYSIDTYRLKAMYAKYMISFRILPAAIYDNTWKPGTKKYYDSVTRNALAENSKLMYRFGMCEEYVAMLSLHGIF